MNPKDEARCPQYPLQDHFGNPDTVNHYGVTLLESKGGIFIERMPERHGFVVEVGPLTADEVLRLVAWLSVVAKLTDEQIAAARRQIEEA